MSRIDSLVGSVTSVDDVLAGSVLRDDHAAGELVLRVVDAADFAESGGSVEVDGTLYDYTAADLADDVLTLAVPLLAAVEADTLATVAPRSPSRMAVVEVEDADDPLRVVVPQALVDQMPTGLRDPYAAETVTVAPVDGVWQVHGIHAVGDRTVKEGRFSLGRDETTGGIQEDGSADFTQMRATEVVEDGVPLQELLGPRLQSLGDFRTPNGVVYGPSAVDLALIEVTVDVPPGHRLFLNVRGWMRGLNAGTIGLLRCSHTFSTTGVPPRPTGGSTELLPYAPVTYETSWRPVTWTWSFGTTSGGTIRALIWIARQGGGSDPMARDFVVEPTLAKVHQASGFAGTVLAREGPTTPDDPPPPTPPPSLVERTLTYDLGPHSLWTGGTRAIYGYRLQDVQAGRSSSGQLWRTHILAPTAARNAIADAEELVSARVRLAMSERLNTMRPSIGTTMSTNITGDNEPSVRNIAPGSRTYSPASPAGWTDLAATTLSALKAGDPGLFITYPSAGTPVGRFHGPGASSSLRPRLEITVRSRT